MRKMISEKEALQIKKNKEDIDSIQQTLGSSLKLITGEFELPGEEGGSNTLITIITNFAYDEEGDPLYSCSGLTEGDSHIAMLLIDFENDEITVDDVSIYSFDELPYAHIQVTNVVTGEIVYSVDRP